MGLWDTQDAMAYTLQGIYNYSAPFKLNGEMREAIEWFIGHTIASIDEVRGGYTVWFYTGASLYVDEPNARRYVDDYRREQMRQQNLTPNRLYYTGGTMSTSIRPPEVYDVVTANTSGGVLRWQAPEPYYNPTCDKCGDKECRKTQDDGYGKLDHQGRCPNQQKIFWGKVQKVVVHRKNQTRNTSQSMV